MQDQGNIYLQYQERVAVSMAGVIGVMAADICHYQQVLATPLVAENISGSGSDPKTNLIPADVSHVHLSVLAVCCLHGSRCTKQLPRSSNKEGGPALTNSSTAPLSCILRSQSPGFECSSGEHWTLYGLAVPDSIPHQIFL